MEKCIKLLLLSWLSIVIIGCDENNELFSSLDSSLKLEKTDYVIDSNEQTLKIKVQADSVFDVICNVDWITDSLIEADGNTYILLLIDAYEGVENDRTGTVDIKLRNSTLGQTVTIVQEARKTVMTDSRVINLSLDEQTFNISLKSNCDYTVKVSDEGKGWLTLVETPETKALTESILTFSVKENKTDSDRTADIFISIRDSKDTDTVRVIQGGLNSLFLPGLLERDPKCGIFYQALSETGLRDTLCQYIDYNYRTPSSDSLYSAYKEGRSDVHKLWTAYDQNIIVWPEKRLFKYTLFAVPDSILNVKYGIRTVDDLRRYAQSIYPEGASLPDNERKSSLNQLISYHILPCALEYDQLNVSDADIVKNFTKWDEWDIEDYYETLLPHSIMRISTPKGAGDNALGVYINRKGTVKDGLVAGGIRIATPSEYQVKNNTSNGVFHYVDDLLLYDAETRNVTLNTRIRAMISTLSPDFINGGVHDITAGGYASIAYQFIGAFCRNFYWSEGTTRFVICSRRDYYALGERDFIRGFDDGVGVAFKLPPVPSDGEYEIRLFCGNFLDAYISGPALTQFSLFESTDPNPSGDMTTWNWVDCGQPVDMRINTEAWESDSDLGGIEAIRAKDRELRENGYMKAMDIYSVDGISLRDNPKCYRKIITATNMKSDNDYYLRLKSDDFFDMYLCCIELVPKNIYDGPSPEDWH